jgi:preprotein translocase subunit SecY
MTSLTYKLKLIFQDSVLRKRILFTIVALVVFRLLASIPVPSVDTQALAGFLSNNEFLGLLNVFSGGGLSGLSIVMLGVGPYITASIIMQLMTVMSKRLKEIYQEEGEAGRRKFSQWSRMLTIPLGIIQSFSFIKILENQKVLLDLTSFDILTNVIVITAGSMLLVFIGELITEYGIGNGVSLIIFSGIVSALPTGITQLFYSYDPSQIPFYILMFVIAILVIMCVVFITEAERPIPVTYAKQVRGNRVYGGASTYLPLRVSQAGVMPIIFAASLLSFPQIILKFLTQTSNSSLQTIANFFDTIINNLLIYGIIYFVLVFVFTYFYTAVTFDPNQISENLQKNGAFIPGVRPGRPTSEYISKILTRITLFGALFFGMIAVLPIAVRSITGITAISIGGTALLIVVSVVIDLVKKLDAQLSAREY